jgi:receptor protein-tyrosine kinase
MSDDAGRLNLIQRAVRRASPSPATPLRAEPDAAALVQTLRKEIPAPAAPSVRQHEQAQGKPQQASEPEREARIRFGELRKRGMITPDNLRSNIAFEFRALKRRLLAKARDPETGLLRQNLVMITSALPSEGKTFTAANLALGLASERDIHVLLIDADVIHPSLTGLFEMPTKIGLTDLLNGTCKSIAEVLHQCPEIPNMSFIAAGQRDERAPELISSRRTAEMFADMSARYPDRIVIIDTPPVLASAETANLAAYMHQVLMVVASGGSNRNQVQTALDNVSACPNVSVIFNKAAKWNKPLGYDYYYYGREGGQSAS